MKYTTFLFTALSLSFGNAAVAVELASTLNGYITSCDVTDKSGQTLLAWLGAIDDKRIVSAKPTLPIGLADALGDPSVIDKSDHWLVTVPVKASTFNGVKISRIERWAGKDNGIYGFAIVFDASPAVIKAAFKRVRFKTDETGVKAILVFDKVTGKSSLVCDSSN